MNIKKAVRIEPRFTFHSLIWVRGLQRDVEINVELVERVSVRYCYYQKEVVTEHERPWYLGGWTRTETEVVDDGSDRLFAHHMASGDMIYLDRNLLEQENGDTPTSASVDS